ncbi:hypothetical protein [Bacillus sp. X1(2014)]|uniref:hypothetical protein n=1 Tax=Bacillus sp. X1(2014) TaxID=1565991 RepID=UPI00164302C1|nr:hypothetical protein [Bacillus sp. X1(2014)]
MVRVWVAEEDGYVAMASDGDRAVWNCYGSTREAAKEMALYKLKIFIDEILMEESQ